MFADSLITQASGPDCPFILHYTLYIVHIRTSYFVVLSTAKFLFAFCSTIHYTIQYTIYTIHPLHDGLQHGFISSENNTVYNTVTAFMKTVHSQQLIQLSEDYYHTL